MIERYAVRAILLSREREVLLMKIRNPESKLAFWICPGGGRQDGEDEASAFERELREELGIEVSGTGALVWKRHHSFRWRGRQLSQHESFYLLELEKFSPVLTDEVEAEVFEGFRWWTLEEVECSSEQIAPKSLSKIVRDYLRDGPPQSRARGGNDPRLAIALGVSRSRSSRQRFREAARFLPRRGARCPGGPAARGSRGFSRWLSRG